MLSFVAKDPSSISFIRYAFGRMAGSVALSKADRERLIKFYTRQLAISHEPAPRASDDPFARIGLRVRFKPRAHLRRVYQRVFY